MKKVIRNLVIGVTCATMLFAVAGCGPEEGNGKHRFDTENRPVALAIGALDENFNPFFYTAAYDGEVVGMTQISMLTADADGNIVCGEDHPTMALDYSITQYASHNDSQVWESGDVDHTTYKFVIKKGVKDSMGFDMDIKDVLFNLYVYLDPAYTGSATIYSTDIRGLASYRAQQNLDDDASFDIEEKYRPAALKRIEAIRDYDSTDGTTSFSAVRSDIMELSKIFKDGLKSDWTSVVGTVDSYTEYNFTKDWQVFLFNEGLVGYQYRYNSQNNLERIKVDGKYLTVLDPAHEDARPFDSSIVNAMQDELDKGTSEQDAAMNVVFSSYLYEITDGENKGYYDGNTTGSLSELLDSSYGNELIQQFIREARSADYAGKELTVNSISGIKTEKATTFKGKDLGGEYDVLSITINGVDPAAIYNFAFNVAPLHYYSGTGADGKDYVKICEEHWSETGDDATDNRFGVPWGDDKFMQDVIGAPAKTKAPVGAGAYKMREGANFFNGSIVEYERNTNFTTLGKDIDNAKIKYLRYVYTTDDQIINSLKNQVVDYGTPNCTPKNIQEITNVSHLNNRNYPANGFGYVGINPTQVPDREVRLAIMLSMNPNSTIIKDYYTEQYSEEIFRPTSKTNFLNTNDKTGSLTHPYVSGFTDLMPESKTEGITYKYTPDADVIRSLVESAGYVEENGKYYKNNKMLSLTFTIAGETADHPAYNMFVDAAEFLNDIGFDITVKNDRQALIKLASGNLAVWAAAWSTGIDPDLYQIYHKDSKASSTRNWGYQTIMNNQTEFAEENSLIQYISDEIDTARSDVNEQFRTIHYVNALNGIMELAVELPTYQRHDLAVYNKEVINPSSLNQNPTANAGVLFKIWELDYN